MVEPNRRHWAGSTLSFVSQAATLTIFPFWARWQRGARTTDSVCLVATLADRVLSCVALHAVTALTRREILTPNHKQVVATDLARFAHARRDHSTRRRATPITPIATSTVLTSLTDAGLQRLVSSTAPIPEVLRLARFTLDGMPTTQWETRLWHHQAPSSLSGGSTFNTVEAWLGSMARHTLTLRTSTTALTKEASPTRWEILARGTYTVLCTGAVRQRVLRCVACGACATRALVHIATVRNEFPGRTHFAVSADTGGCKLHRRWC